MARVTFTRYLELRGGELSRPGNGGRDAVPGEGG